jgi:hypothetical protein
MIKQINQKRYLQHFHYPNDSDNKLYKVSPISLLDDDWIVNSFITKVILVSEFVHGMKNMKNIISTWPFGCGIFIEVKNGKSELFAVRQKLRYLTIPEYTFDVIIKLCTYDSKIVDLLEISYEKEKTNSS